MRVSLLIPAALLSGVVLGDCVPGYGDPDTTCTTISSDPTETSTDPVTSITETSTEITETSTEITETSTEITETSTEITETSTEITETSTEITETSTEITETVTEITETSTEITETPTEITETPTEITETSTEIPSTTSASRTTSQPPPPDPTASCDPSCHCATGGKPVPTEGRWLCGWCAAVSTDEGHFLNVTDVVLCKDNKCCNYGILDGRCERALLETPPDWETWCPWPVNQLDPPPNSTESTSSSSTEWITESWPVPSSSMLSSSHGLISTTETEEWPFHAESTVLSAKRNLGAPREHYHEGY